MSAIFDLENDVDLAEVLDSDNEELVNNAVVSRRKKQKKRSPIWEYFEEIVDNSLRYARCKLCVDKVTKYLMSGGSNSITGNMSRHLEKDHAGDVVLGAFERDDSVFVYSQENFRKALVKWIVMSDQPFTEPEQKEFVQLVQSLNPEAVLISDKTVRADIMEKYGEKLETVKDMMTRIPGKLSISIDGWTSRNVLPFFAIRGHWLDADWNYESSLLDFQYIDGKHSGWKHSCIFRDCLERLTIPMTKIFAVTGDNASNNDTFFDWLEEHGLSSWANQLRCLCHILNLAVQDLLKLLKVSVPDDEEVDAEDYDLESEELEDIDMNEGLNDDIDEEEDLFSIPVDETTIIERLRKIVKKIRKSVKLRQKLAKCCAIYGVEYRVPIIDCKTRWNSTDLMISRAKELKIPLRALCVHDKSFASLQLSDEEWSYLDLVEELLRKFKRATKFMSMERHSTIPSYIPTLNWIIDSVRDFANRHTGTLRYAAEGALLKLQKYEVKVDKCIIPFIATVLHPALKLNYFKEHKYPAVEIREIKKAVTDYFIENYENSEDNDEPETPSDDELHEHIFKRSRIQKTSSELLKYLSLPLADRKVEPLAYWKSQTQQFPRLSMMARDVLPAQAASTCVERDFSKGGRLVTPARCAMLKTTIRATMSLKSWYSLKTQTCQPI